MLNLVKVYEAIESKGSLIRNFQQQSERLLQTFSSYCQQLSSISVKDFNSRLVAYGESFAGALATDELQAKGLRTDRFDEDLTSHEDICIWKEQILKDRAVCAVDGSQIEADKNLGLFFGAVQVAWYVNFHSLSRGPIKDVHFDIVLPNDSLDEEQEFKQYIAFQRFSQEIRALALWIERVAASQSPKTPVAFFDGSLTLSFVPTASLRRQYQEEVNHLLFQSEKYQVPIVAFIDTSQAYNLSKSLQIAFGKDLSGRVVPDVKLLKPYLTQWGDRSAFFKYFDSSLGANAQPESFAEVGFCYLKTSSRNASSARLELPYWVFQKGLLDEVVDVVLAECLVGNGYPYPLEVADSVAVLQASEREVFYATLEKKLGMELGKSNKLQSKHNRRKASIKL